MKRAIRNACIEKADFDIERGLTYWITLDYGDSSHQTFGGFGLGGTFGCEAIRRLLMILGVQYWSELRGKPCRADSEHSKVYRLGHYLKDEWLDLAALAKEHEEAFEIERLVMKKLCNQH